MTLPEIAIKRPVTTLMALLTLALFGAIALSRLPLAFMPEMVEPSLFVRVPYPGATPEQVERSIVRPVEEAIGSVKGLHHMWSNCDRDGGMVGLFFDWSTDVDMARVEVREKIDRIRKQLPDDIGEISISSSWDSREQQETVLEGRIASNRDLSESYDLLERKIVAPLERIPGVASVNIDGVNPREIRINLRLSDLQAHHLDVRELTATLTSANFEQSLGVIRETDRRFSLRTVATFASLEEIRALPVGRNGLRLSDVADVVYTEPPLEYGRHLDGKFAVGVSVNKEAGANSVEICRLARERIDRMGDDAELEGINFLVWEDQGKEIRNTLRDLAETGVLGSLLAVVVLYFFLRRVGATLVAVSCIPFSLIVTCGVIWAQGRTLNTISLLGLIVGVGMLVDNAVVVMENIFRHQEMGEDPRTASLNGSRQITTAVVTATMTAVIVFMPMIFNEKSEMNIILRELGLTIVCTLLASLLISQTLIPLATSRFLKSKPPRREPWLRWLEGRHERAMRFTLAHRWIGPVVGIAVTASGVWPFMKIDKNFDTNPTDLFVQINYDFSEEQSLKNKEALVTQVEKTIEPLKDAMNSKSIYSFWSDRFSMTRIYMKEGFASEAYMNRAKEKLRAVLPVIPGTKLEIQEANHQMWNMDRGKRVAFQLTGEDSEVLAGLAEIAKQRIGEIPGLIDPFASTQQGSQEIHVTVNRELARTYGVPIDLPGRAIDLTFRGRRLRKFRTNDTEVEMRVTLDEQEQESLAQLRNLPIPVEGGKTIPLAAIANFAVVPGSTQIDRQNRITNVWVGAKFEEGTREQYLPLVTAVAEGLNYPMGYTFSFQEGERDRQERQSEALVNLGLALLLVFAVMASLFESTRQALALLVSLPFALSGAAWTLYFTGTDFDQPAFIGLLLLIGVVVNNGIVMLDLINHNRREGMPRYEAMISGGRDRLRPILMTTMTTLLGLVPIVVRRPALAGVYYYSMALVIMGGLAVSTFLTAILLPVTASLSEDLFAAIGRVPGRVARLIPRRGVRTAPAESAVD